MSARRTSKPRTSAVAYLRMSSKKQDKSIPAQRTEVERYAKAHGYQIIREYADEGISGSESEKREGFQRLIQDAQDVGDFEAVLCWDQDRFSRFDPLEANHYWYLLRRCGVKLVTVLQGELNWDDLGGWLTASVNQHGKAQYLKDLARNSSRGRRESARRGNWPARPPYGYRKDNGRLVVDPETGPIVRWLFEEYVDSSTSLRALADKLNVRGVPAPNGGPWAAHKIRNLLLRESYKGDAFFNRRDKPKEDWIPHECPPLVSENVWDDCQRVLSERKRNTTPHRAGGEYLLSGLLYCQNCGGRMIGYRRNQGQRMAYMCGNYLQFGRRFCTCNTIKQDILLDFVVESLQERVLSDDVIREVRREVEASLAKDSRSAPSTIKALEARIGTLDEEIRQATAELKRTPDDLYPLAVEHLRDLQQQRGALVGDLSDIRAKRHSHAEQVDRIVGRLGNFRKCLDSGKPKLVRNVMHEFIDRIDLTFTTRRTAKTTRSELAGGELKLKGSDLLHSGRKRA